MPMMRQVAMMVAAASMLGGCASAPDVRTAVQKGTYFVLAEDYSQSTTRGPDKIKWIVVLRAGSYVAEDEDEKGVSFRGAPGSVIMMTQDAAEQYLRDQSIDPKSRWDGGVWLPGSKTDNPRIYFFPWVRPLPGTEIRGGKIVPLPSHGFAWGPEITESSFVREIKLENQ